MSNRQHPEQAGERPRILLVEDDDGVRRSMHLMLQGHGFDVRSYGSAEPVLADAPTASAACLVADYKLPDSDGVGLLTALHDAGWSGRAVLITGYPSDPVREAAWAAGYDAIVEKPFRQRELVDAIDGVQLEPEAD
jgi:FixJ family two-component response regulator